MAFRILPGLLGAFFLLQGSMWLIDPGGAAEGLGMPLLEGAARSTQIGDLSGFFLCLGGFALFGAIRLRPDFVRAAGCLVGLVAVTRTIAWAAHGAEFTTQFIVIEVVCGALLGLSASRLEAEGAARLEVEGAARLDVDGAA